MSPAWESVRDWVPFLDVTSRLGSKEPFPLNDDQLTTFHPVSSVKKVARFPRTKMLAQTVCHVCKSLDIKDFFGVGKGGKLNLCDVNHRKSLQDLEKSKASCSLCALFFDVVRENVLPGQTDSAIWTDHPIVLRGILTEAGALFWIKVRCGFYYGYCNLHPVTEYNSKKTVIIPQGQIAGEEIMPADSDRNWERLRGWVDRCKKEHHSSCRGSSSSYLPTRVINVGKVGEDQVRLEVTTGKGQKGPYMALSHCWGPYQIIRTVTNNYAQHQQSIPLGDLTNTFRDAVKVTRMLGVKYLWIDSLCIIQDSSADWVAEAAKMGSVYQNSYLTVAAAYSSDGHGGCLRSSPPHSLGHIKWTMNQGVGWVALKPRLRDFLTLPSSVLHTRAWVLQERILSPRAIHYDHHQMLWECRSARWCESGVPEDAFTVPQQRAWDGRLHFEAGMSPRKFWWDWYDLLQDYTARKITHGDDRLPALSGLASTLASVTRGQYVAGLWLDHFPWGLLWRKQRDWMTSAPKYRAPTWSWAAWDGQVKFFDQADLEGYSARAVSDVQDMQAMTKPLGSDKFGQLEDGWLRISGYILECEPRATPGSLSHAPVEGIMPHLNLSADYIKTTEGRRLGMAFYDLPYQPGLGKLFVLRVAVMMNGLGNPIPTSFLGLILRANGKPGEFMRVGIVEHRRFAGEGGKSDPFAKAPRRTVVIR